MSYFLSLVGEFIISQNETVVKGFLKTFLPGTLAAVGAHLPP